MIVNLIDAGWEITHQPAHGLLAFQLAMHWQPDTRPAHWPETLIALTEHDDGQLPYEGRNHLTTAGAPLHFQVLEFSVEQAKNMVNVALQKSRWNALMVSMHASFLYEEKRGESAGLDEFLDEQKENQQSWRREYKVSKAVAQYAYDFVQWCDAFSLILCLNQVPPEGRRLEISIGPDGVHYYVFQRKDESIGVEPWPYNVPEFTAHIEYNSLNQLVFTDDQELYNALQKAPVQVREWRLSNS
ncbi:DUF3891 family protein [Fibrella forsythiae]|uniref:DUF3891 family protein n=1 Tax=Fibrella forsythiae TaxID=2817061 RepID=A0ABS3JRZ0_9BACT|nr:DUF3891 family protein [Fibrella forsythiae]MBO0952774.1 DUF3891 family protein [Fibrella forsythiae]